MNKQTSRRFLAKLAVRRAARRAARAALLLPLGAALFAGQSARAANVVYTETSTGAVNYSAATFTPAGTPGVGDVVQYNNATTANTTTLDVPLTLGGLRNSGAAAFSFLADGVPNVLTLNATGLTTAGNQLFGNASTAFIGASSTGALTVTTPLVLANTNLDIGATAASTVTIGGAITASTAQTINFRANNAGAVVNVNGAIGASGSNITIANLGNSTGSVNLLGNLGPSVTTVTQNSAGSFFTLAGTNTYAGGTTLTQGGIQGTNLGTTNEIRSLGTGNLNLNGGTLFLRANGNANGATIITGTGVAGGANSVVVGGNTTIDASRLTAPAFGTPAGTFTGEIFQLQNLSIGANTLTTAGNTTSASLLQFAGTTTLTGAAGTTTTFNLGIGTTLTGAVGGASNLVKNGTAPLTLASSNTVTGSLTINAGTVNLGLAAGAGVTNTFSSITNQGGTLTATNGTSTANTFLVLGTGLLSTSSGASTTFVANGSNSNAQVITGNGTVGNNVAINNNNVAFNTNRVSGTNTGVNIVFNDLTLGTGVTNLNSGFFLATYGARFTGTPTLNGSTTFNAPANGINAQSSNSNVSNFTFDNPFVVAGGSTAFGISKLQNGALILGGANNYTGATVITGATQAFGNTNGGISLGGGNTSGSYIVASAPLGGGSILNTSSIALGGSGTLQFDNTTANADRVADALPIAFNQNGRLILLGNATTNSTETVGQLNFNAGDHILTVGSGGAGRVTTLAAAGITRNNLATALVRGSSLNQTAATNVGRIVLGATGSTPFSGADFVGTNTLTGGATGDATQGLRIVPWLLGDTSVTGAGTHFVTYDNGNDANGLPIGLRVLTTAQETALTAGFTSVPATPPNATATGTLAITAADPTVNSLLFTGASTLSGTGTLTVNSGAIANGSNNVVTINGFGSLAMGNGEGIFNVAQSTLNVNVPVGVSGGGGITKAGSGTLVLGSAANTFTGQATVNQGTLQFATGINNALNGTAGTAVQVNGGTFNLNGTTQAVTTLGVATNGTVTVGAGTLNLGGNVTYDGTGNALNGFSGNVTATTTGAINLNGTRTFTVGDSNASGFELNVNTGTVGIADGTVAGSGIVKAGAGTLALNGANTFTGGVTVNAGALFLGNATAAGTGPIALAGGTLAAPVSLIINNSNLANPINVTGVANFLTTADNANGNNTGALTGNGTLIAPQNVNLNGFTQNAVSSLKYNGSIAAFSGTFIDNTTTNVIFQNAASNGSALARFQINGSAFTPVSLQTAPQTFNMGELSGASTGAVVGSNANANLATISVGALNTDSTYAGRLVNGGGTGGGPLALTKVGTGTLTLTSAQAGTINGTAVIPYSGGTAINGGTLLVNGGVFNATTPATSTSGTGSGAVTVGNGSTLNGILGGSGVLNVGANVLTVNAGSTLAPGNSPGILTVVGTQTASAPAFAAATLNLAPSANLAIELNGATPGNTATSYDQIVLFGTVALNGANLTLSLGNGFNPVGTTFTIIDNNTAIDLVGGTFANGSALTAANDTGAYNFAVSYTGGDGNNVTLTASPVPEPSTYALLGLGLAGVAFGVARRRRIALAV